MRKHSIVTAVGAALVCLSGTLQPVFSEGLDSTVSPESKASAVLTGLGIHFSGFWSLETGQLENYWMTSFNINHQNLLRTIVNFGMTKQITPRLQIQAGAEGKMYYNTFDKKYNFGVEAFVLPTMYYNFYFDRAFMEYSFGDLKAPFLQFTVGYFPYKYNPDARDLGEYLYRTGTYPAYIINDFDFTKARLAGLKVSSDLFGMLHQDLLLTTGTDRPPFFDLNLGYVASLNVGNVLTIGLGAMYQSLVSTNIDITSPKLAENTYLKNPVLDPVTNTYSGDTAYYTFAGLKVMGRLSFDPKRIFAPSEEDLGIFGKEDLKIFGEAAILGVQNYPVDVINPNNPNPYGYDTLLQKIPVMFGLNIPTFKILDVLSAQAEWYDCQYPNNYQFKGMAQITPTPCPQTGGVAADNYSHRDNWKWCFYAKKSFSNGLFIVGQVANDHIRNETPIAASVDFEDALRTDKSWWWALKLGFKF
jgi:hypothetical protein